MYESLLEKVTVAEVLRELMLASIALRLTLLKVIGTERRIKSLNIETAITVITNLHYTSKHVFREINSGQ